MLGDISSICSVNIPFISLVLWAAVGVAFDQLSPSPPRSGNLCGCVATMPLYIQAALSVCVCVYMYDVMMTSNEMVIPTCHINCGIFHDNASGEFTRAPSCSSSEVSRRFWLAVFCFLVLWTSSASVFGSSVLPSWPLDLNWPPLDLVRCLWVPPHHTS